MALTLLLDVGGTRLKWAWCQGPELVATGGAAWLDAADRLADEQREMEAQAGGPLQRIQRLSRAWPPAAGNLTEADLSERLGVAVDVMDIPQGLPFSVGYTSGAPGTDRLAAAMACHHRDPGGSFVIVDAGTCVTVDLLSPGAWRGGAILPGLRLQSEAMAQAGLPVLQADADGKWPWRSEPEGALGTSTSSALEAGIPRALRLAVERTAQDLKQVDPCAQVILTGGDAAHFDGLGGWQTFADPNLVLTGAALLLNDFAE